MGLFLPRHREAGFHRQGEGRCRRFLRLRSRHRQGAGLCLPQAPFPHSKGNNRATDKRILPYPPSHNSKRLQSSPPSVGWRKFLVASVASLSFPPPLPTNSHPPSRSIHQRQQGDEGMGQQGQRRRKRGEGNHEGDRPNQPRFQRERWFFILTFSISFA